MSTVLHIIALVGSVITLITGAWGLATFGQNSTPELREMQMWICISLVGGGVALVALSLARFFPTVSRRLTD